MKTLVSAALAAGIVLSSPACMTFVAGRKISATGRVIVGHNEDDWPPLVVRHGMLPARDWPKGSFLPATPGCCAKVPQAPHTLACYWGEVKFLYGDGNADTFLNERGVIVVSDSGGKSTERMDDPTLLTEGGVKFNLRRAVGERATSARDGVRIIGELVEKYGYAPSARIYTVADADEAWLVQVVHGRNYVAVRCPDDEVTIMPNLYTVYELDAFPAADVIASKDLVENAKRKGFWDGKGKFNFAKAYQGSYKYGPTHAFEHPNNTGRFRQAIRLLTGEEWPEGKPFPFSVKPRGQAFSVADMKALLSAHNPPSKAGAHVLESWSICSSTTIESSVCEFAADPRDTVLHVAVGRGCEKPYLAFRPFSDPMPSKLDDFESAERRLETHVTPVASLTCSVSIVVPAASDAVVRTAANELRDYLGKMGVQSVSIEKEGSSPPAGRSVYIGRTAFAAAHGIEFGKFADEEWMVREVDGSLVIGGGGRRGALYGVYHFLEDALGVRWFSPYVESVPRRDDVSWAGLSLRGRPAMRYRDIYYVTGPGAAAFLARNRMNTESPEYGGRMRYSRAATNHSLYRYLGKPEEVRALFADHPDWFPLIDGERRLDPRANSASKTQLCLTNPGLRQHFIDCVRRHIAADRAVAKRRGIEPPMFYAIDQNDCYDGFCRCPGCAAIIEREGGTSGLLMDFANAVAAALETDAPDATFQMMAYFSTERPPRTVRPRRNVGIRLCDPVSDVCRPWSDPANGWMRGNLEAWHGICDKIAVWDYQITYGWVTCTGYPTPTERTFAPDMRLLAANGGDGVFFEHEAPVGADMRDMKVWLEMKLVEDPSLDAEKLIVQFTDGFYGPAGRHIRRYRDLVARAAAAKGSAIKWFPCVGSYGFLDDSAVAEADAIFAEAARSVAGDAERSERVDHARLALDKLCAMRDNAPETVHRNLHGGQQRRLRLSSRRRYDERRLRVHRQQLLHGDDAANRAQGKRCLAEKQLPDDQGRAFLLRRIGTGGGSGGEDALVGRDQYAFLRRRDFRRCRQGGRHQDRQGHVDASWQPDVQRPAGCRGRHASRRPQAQVHLVPILGQGGGIPYQQQGYLLHQRIRTLQQRGSAAESRA